MKNEIKVKRLDINVNTSASIVIEDLDLSFNGNDEEIAAYTLKIMNGLKSMIG